MSQTFDTLFAASGPDAAEGGENPVPEFVEADVATVETPAPTITPTGYQTLVAVIRFSLGSTALDDNDREIIQSIADAHRQRGGHIRLAGYASKDSEGSGDTEEMLENFNLSVDRATAVADELVRQGVASDAVVIDAQGDSASSGLAQGQSSAAEQRRVDVYFTN
jgi:outer membrane protein OmpA-like peptidoglycan-associated protein